MTKKELEKLFKVLHKIANPDAHVKECIAAVEKNLAQYSARRGQLRDTYEYDDKWRL